MKKYKLVVLIAIVALIVITFSVGFYYKYQISPVSRDSEKVIVEIKAGSVSSIGDTLYENGLIRSKFMFKVFVKLNGVNDLKASTYELNKNMKLVEIIDVLKEGNAYNPDEVRITFKEGLNVRKIARLVEENTNNSYDDFMNLMDDDSYIDSLIDKYWFLSDEIKDEKIYYPLEGYLFPNTYAFLNKDVEVKTIVETMLDEMGEQLEEYREKIEDSEFSLHEILTLASIVELEGASFNDRKSVAGAFYNRLTDDSWTTSIGSDVTTYYYLKIDDFNVKLTYEMGLGDCDGAYNTRCNSFVGLPVGPISNPGFDSLDATINYREHDYHFFLADCSGKTYMFTSDEYRQGKFEAKKTQLDKEGNWCG